MLCRACRFRNARAFNVSVTISRPEQRSSSEWMRIGRQKILARNNHLKSAIGAYRQEDADVRGTSATDCARRKASRRIGSDCALKLHQIIESFRSIAEECKTLAIDHPDEELSEYLREVSAADDEGVDL